MYRIFLTFNHNKTLYLLNETLILAYLFMFYDMFYQYIFMLLFSIRQFLATYFNNNVCTTIM